MTPERSHLEGWTPVVPPAQSTGSTAKETVLIVALPNFKSVIHLFLICVALTAAVVPVLATSNEDMVLVWSDEFGGSAGQSPDASKWDYDIGTDWGNAQLEYDTDRPTNVSLDGNGYLAIVAREEWYAGQSYTSARIVTRNLYEPTYGRIEARIKLPTGQGIWPAFWLLGNDIGSVGWPQCGEIDIMEYRGQEPNIAYGTLHGPGYSGGGGIGSAYVLYNDRFDTAFHTFSVEWEENVIRWYIDGVLYHSVGPDDLGGAEWVFDHPFYIILNVAVGGTFVGSPDGSTVFPQTMLVDYVRVYQRSSLSCCELRGDLDLSGSVNVADLTYLIAHLFKGGSASLCGGNGDVDGSGSVNVSDLTYLVARLFKGGPLPPVCPVSQYVPTSPAPTPTVDPSDVISLFSDAYSDVAVDTWSASWDMANVQNYMIGSDYVKKYTQLVYAGIEFANNPIDATAMTQFHIDVWTPDPTDAPSTFRIKLVDFGANGVWDGGGDDVEHEITLDESTMNTGSWVSLDIPLSSFTGLTTRGHLAQLILSGDPDTVYVDNIYLYSSGLPTAPWDMADVADYAIGSDHTKKYTNLVFAGIEFASATIDASIMTHFHIDVWTPDPTVSPSVFKIKLVDFGANGVWNGGGDDVEHEIVLDGSTMNTATWVSIDLPLTAFTGLITRGHVAQLILSGDPNTVYVDNIYFHR